MTSSFEGSITTDKRAQRAAAVGTGSCEAKSETGSITSERRTRKYETSYGYHLHIAGS